MEGNAEAIRHFILREFLPGEDPGELGYRTPLITGGILDSISTLKLVAFLEDHFGIAIEAHEAGVDHLDTIERIGALVGAKRGAT
jgi:acyl carrier protein